VIKLELVIVSASPLVVNVVAKELVNKSELELTTVCVLLVTTLLIVGLVNKFEPESIIILTLRGSEYKARTNLNTVVLTVVIITIGSNEKNKFGIKYYNYS
jgi:hypothetical protein